MKRKDTIHALFEAQVAKTPTITAIVHEHQTITYEELNKKTNQIARFLLEQRVKLNTQVALCMERSVDLLTSILAILKLGCAYIPLDSNHPEERLLYTLQDNNNPILITTSNFKNKFVRYQKNLIIIDEVKSEINQQQSGNLNHPVSTHNLAYIIYTSGSTGKPKGVEIEHKNVINYTHWFANYSHCQPKQRIDFSSNTIVDMAITTSIVPLMLGLTVVICNEEIKKNARAYLKFIAENKIHSIKITPSYFKFLLQELRTHPIALPHLKNLTLGGENLSTTDCAFWLNLYPNHLLFNEYGPTEATVAVTQFTISKSNISSLGVSVPIGKPGQNIRCLILGEDKTPKKDGEIGELYIGGDCLARGYLHQPELTDNCFIQSAIDGERLYKTGDLAIRQKKGIFEFVGRIDNQVKIRGFRIDPNEIEKHLLNHPMIENCVVLGREDKTHEKRLIAYYLPKDKSSLVNALEMRDYLKQYLPDYMLPAAYVKIASFPLTPNGKLDHAALPIPQFIVSQNYQEPTSKLEKKLAEIWSNELKVKPIGKTDDFFELGGHSLAAARIVTQINDILGREIRLSDFYQATTIQQLANFIAQTRKTSKENPDNSQHLPNSTKHLPLSDFQFILWLSTVLEKKARKINVVKRKQIKGQLDKKALNMAFAALLKKHVVLSFYFLKWRPVQIFQQNLTLQLQEKDLRILSTQEKEHILNQSINELRHYFPWPKNEPLLRAKLFYLANNDVELQIVIPHIISDDLSLDILLDDLSEFYLHYQEQPESIKVYPDNRYTQYIFDEQFYFQEHWEKDFAFWQSYLNKSSLFSFPIKHVVKVKNPEDFFYTTYLKISAKKIGLLQQFCANHHLNINNSLCAAVVLAIYRCCNTEEEKESQSIYVNIVKSTRDNPRYDHTLGCFLRLEPIKIELNGKTNFAQLLEQIHQAEMLTNPHQRCSNIVKFASIGRNLPQQRKTILPYLFSPLISLYLLLFPSPPFYRRLFKLCSPLISLKKLKKKNNFIINLNIQADFVEMRSKNKSSLFGLKTKKIKYHPEDLLKIDNFFDVCFQYSDQRNAHYLAISANLLPTFRESIAKEVLKILGCIDKLDFGKTAI